MRLLRLLTLVCFVASVSLWAGTIGPSCGTCDGTSWSLNFSNLSTGAVTDSFTVTLAANTSGYTGGGTDVHAVSVKPSTSIVSAILSSAPGGIGAWTTQLGGLNAAGCDGSGAGFFCSQSTGLGAAVGGTLSWTWTVVVPHGTWFTGADEASIKAEYVNALGVKTGDLLSEDITDSPSSSVPEPAMLSMIGVGLLVIAGRRKAIKK